MADTSSQSSIRWKFVSLTFFAALVSLICWEGADRRATDSTQPLNQGPANSVLRDPPPTLKVGSFNIHGGKGRDGIRDLSRIASLLTDVDCAGLYEVRSIAEGHESNQAAALGSRCAASWIYAPSERQWWSDHFGNGLIYRIPVHSFLRIPLVNTRGKAYRIAVLSIAELQGSAVRMIAVHIDRENDRRSQLRTIIDLFLSLEEPCLLMGDLNTAGKDPLLIDLREHPGVRSPLHETLGESAVENNIDWIFTRGLRTLSAKLVENNASDHPFLTAEFEPLQR